MDKHRLANAPDSNGSTALAEPLFSDQDQDSTDSEEQDSVGISSEAKHRTSVSEIKVQLECLLSTLFAAHAKELSALKTDNRKLQGQIKALTERSEAAETRSADHVPVEREKVCSAQDKSFRRFIEASVPSEHTSAHVVNSELLAEDCDFDTAGSKMTDDATPKELCRRPSKRRGTLPTYNSLRRWELLVEEVLNASESKKLNSAKPQEGATTKDEQKLMIAEAVKKLVMRKDWDTDGDDVDPVVKIGSCVRQSLVQPSMNQRGLLNLKAGDVLTEDSIWQKYVIHPHSGFRIAWSFLGMLLLTWDMFVLPTELFGMSEEVDAVAVVSMICFGFWAMDVPLSLMTGSDEGDIVDMRPSVIVPSYLRSWFAPDMAILLVDIMIYLADAADGMVSFRLARMARLFRLVRLLRMRKLSNMISFLFAWIRSHYFFLILRIITMTLGLLTINHCVACCWYGLALATEEPNWISRSGLSNADMGHVYVTSLHWALTQFSPGTNNVAPGNGFERLFCVVTVLFALVFFTSFISQITSSVTELRTVGSDAVRKQNQLRQFVCDRKLSANLWFHIQTYYKLKGVEANLMIHDIAIINEMPESLRFKLHEELYLQRLLSSRFLCVACTDDTLSVVCHTCMSETSLAPRDTIFSSGVEAQYIYVVVRGSVTYYSNYVSGGCEERQADCWFSEIALWTHWLHRGQLDVITHSDVTRIHCEEAARLLSCAGATFRQYLRCVGYLLTAMAEADESSNIFAIFTDLGLPDEKMTHLTNSVLQNVENGGSFLYRVMLNLARTTSSQPALTDTRL
eukprot:TRINITY_DN81653_c0_g1_i1.p1 TRINITY_DN81653_c0_g1~~TRINITY_DN81653_c0_g1_i1.p1  ORF type:complete len:815 (-),score=79.01 TRINITY_DN81653_c0_g1_i1:6-2399(-)